MSDLADLDHIYGEDLGVTPAGDIAIATKSSRTVQRIIRRLLTTPTDGASAAYPWEPDFGVGLGARIGGLLDVREVEATVRSQMLLEPTVQKIPAPIVSVTPIENGDGAVIKVVYADLSGVPQTFSFDLLP